MGEGCGVEVRGGWRGDERVLELVGSGRELTTSGNRNGCAGWVMRVV